jgi:hypothetical protein
MKDKCGQCKHWEAGECFRYPPQMVPFPNDNQHPISYWPAPFQPSVGAEYRACGEFSEARSLECRLNRLRLLPVR